MTTGTPRNPFVPGGHEACPGVPLDPRRHQAFYLDVAGHGPAYARFVRALAEAAEQLGTEKPGAFDALRARGRLIVAQGPGLSGKTTLLRRCVHELERRAAAEANVEICTVDAHTVRTNGTSLTEQAMAVRDKVLATAEGFLEPEVLDRAERKPTAETSYTLLSRSLGPERVIQVLTPSVEHDKSADNIEDLQRWMAPGLVFYAEHTPTERAPLTYIPPSENADPMVVLELGALIPGNARSVVLQRRPEVLRDGLPDFEEVAVERLEGWMKGKQHSLGWLLDLLRSVYDRRIAGAPEYQELPSISFEEILYAWGLAIGAGEQK